MKALVWHGAFDVRVDRVKDPEIVNPRDAIVRVTSTAICGSDLHLYTGNMPTMKPGDVLGHEFMGEVVEVGRDVTDLAKGDRVVVPFGIACGRCNYCRDERTALCDNSNPNANLAEAAYGYSGAALFGYSHMFGGYSGGQAEYVRVPYADYGLKKVHPDLTDEQALFLTDVFPTGYMAAENCNITPGDTVAVWGCGPVGLFAIASARMLGADRVIALDRFPDRLARARNYGAEAYNFEEIDVFEVLRERSGGRGPDACIDAVGMEAHGVAPDALADYALQTLKIETDRPHVLRQAIHAAGKGATISLPGVYGAVVHGFPIGAAFGKGLTFKMGQTDVHKYVAPLMERIVAGELDPTAIISHRMKLADAPAAYAMFQQKTDDCGKVVLTP